jgi:hypothetical protein
MLIKITRIIIKHVHVHVARQWKGWLPFYPECTFTVVLVNISLGSRASAKKVEDMGPSVVYVYVVPALWY